MAEPEERRRFRLGWSTWRRVHQAVAARCRTARRSLGWEGPPEGSDTLEAIAPPSEESRLTGAEWECVAPLLPSQKPPTGRTRNDHRTVLGGILWVARTASSWREMPEEYGKWETAYRRYELWLKRGLWRRILEALGEEDLPGPVTKNHK